MDCSCAKKSEGSFVTLAGKKNAMENMKPTNDGAVPKLTKAQIFLEEWKRRKKEDEELFLKELNDPAHQRRMAEIAGKIVSNGKADSTS